jgi:hypothetical protein
VIFEVLNTMQYKVCIYRRGKKGGKVITRMRFSKGRDTFIYESKMSDHHHFINVHEKIRQLINH